MQRIYIRQKSTSSDPTKSSSSRPSGLLGNHEVVFGGVPRVVDSARSLYATNSSVSQIGLFELLGRSQHPNWRGATYGGQHTKDVHHCKHSTCRRNLYVLNLGLRTRLLSLRTAARKLRTRRLRFRCGRWTETTRCSKTVTIMCPVSPLDPLPYLAFFQP